MMKMMMRVKKVNGLKRAIIHMKMKKKRKFKVYQQAREPQRKMW